MNLSKNETKSLELSEYYWLEIIRKRMKLHFLAVVLFIAIYRQQDCKHLTNFGSLSKKMDLFLQRYVTGPS